MIDQFVIIIGAMKCGTTSLFTHLAEHPGVAASSIKEPGFFSDEGKSGLGREWYESLWEWDPAKHRYALEASSNYTKVPMYPDAAERMADFGAEFGAGFRFIYLVRDPIERIRSHYTHSKAAGLNMQWAKPGGRNHLIRVTQYASQLDHYRRRFGREQILLLDFRELAEEPWALMLKVYDFLGLEAGARPSQLEKAINTNRGRLVEAANRGETMPSEAGPLKRLLGGLRARKPGLGAEKRIKENVELPAGQEKFIRDQLAPDMERLRDEYGFDVSKWGF